MQRKIRYGAGCGLTTAAALAAGCRHRNRAARFRLISPLESNLPHFSLERTRMAAAIQMHYHRLFAVTFEGLAVRLELRQLP